MNGPSPRGFEPQGGVKRLNVLNALFIFFLALLIGGNSWALDLNTANFTWTWVEEVLSPAVRQDGFRVKCGLAAGSYTITHDVPVAAARSLEAKQMLKTGGNYFCAVYGYRGSIESSASNEVNFVITVPGAPPPTTKGRTIEEVAWNFKAGANDPPLSHFLVKCGGKKATYDTVTKVTDTKARKIAADQVTTAPGAWFCVVSAVNVNGEGLPTDEFEVSR